MSAGARAAESVRELLEAAADGMTPTERARKRVARRLPGVKTKQRGRTGTTANADDFNKKHKRVAKGRTGGGQFAKEAPHEHEAKELQRQLKAAGVYLGPIDGQAGPVTLAALKAFQESQGIPATGKLDARTRLALQNPAPRSRAEVMAEERELLADKGKGGSKGGSGGSKREPAEDDPDFNWRKHGNGKRGVTLKDGTRRTVDGAEFDRLKRKGALDERRTPKLQGDDPDDGGSSSRRSRSGSSGSSGSRARSGGEGRELPGGVLRQGVGMDRKRGNADVKQIQQTLQDLGYDLGEAGVDGKFGPQTRRALEAFQREHGLRDDGVFGRHTRRLLNMAGSERSSRRSARRAPLSIDEEPLSRRSSARRTAEAALLLLEAPDAEAASAAERQELWQRFPFVAPSDGSGTGAVALKRDKDGLFVHTHRARSKSFPSVRAIPERVVKFIESTG